jgi:hypothetical protein
LDFITLTLNIGSLIGILGLATFICDIVALYVHRQSDVYRQQKFQDVDVNLLRLETLNTLPLSMMSEESKRKHALHVEEAIRTGHVVDNHIMDKEDTLSNIESPYKERFQRNKVHYNELYDNVSGTSKDTNQQSTPMLIYGNYHQQKLGLSHSINDSTPPSSVKQRRSPTSRPANLQFSPNEKNKFYDKTNIVFVDEDSPEANEPNQSKQLTDEINHLSNNSSPTHRQSNQIPPKIETFL